MYKKAFIKLLNVGIISASVFLFSIFLVYMIMPKVVGVKEIRKKPEMVTGSIAVIGTVTIRDDNSAFFLLSDRQARCKEIPVIYKGLKPESGSEIIAYGLFKKVDGRFNADILWWEFFLEAHKIKDREDIFSGYVSYMTRQWVHKSIDSIYHKCNMCRKIINRLTSTNLFK